MFCLSFVSVIVSSYLPSRWKCIKSMTKGHIKTTLKLLLVTMNTLMIGFIFWCWEIRTSYMQILITESSKISTREILIKFKTHTITECWIKCRQKAGCETIGTNRDNNTDKENFYYCYLLGGKVTKPDDGQEILDVNEKSTLPVSFSRFIPYQRHIWLKKVMIFFPWWQNCYPFQSYEFSKNGPRHCLLVISKDAKKQLNSQSDPIFSWDKELYLKQMEFFL